MSDRATTARQRLRDALDKKKGGKREEVTEKVVLKPSEVAKLEGEALRAELNQYKDSPNFQDLLRDVIFYKFHFIAPKLKQGIDCSIDIEVLLSFNPPRQVQTPGGKCTIQTIFKKAIDETPSLDHFKALLLTEGSEVQKTYYKLCEYTAMKAMKASGYLTKAGKLNVPLNVVLSEMQEYDDVCYYIMEARFPKAWCKGNNTPAEECSIAMKAFAIDTDPDTAKVLGIPTLAEELMKGCKVEDIRELPQEVRLSQVQALINENGLTDDVKFMSEALFGLKLHIVPSSAIGAQNPGNVGFTGEGAPDAEALPKI